MCAQESHWNVQNVNSVTTILQKTKRHIQTEWKSRNIVDSAKLTLYTKKQSNFVLCNTADSEKSL